MQVHQDLLPPQKFPNGVRAVSCEDPPDNWTKIFILGKLKLAQSTRTTCNRRSRNTNPKDGEDLSRLLHHCIPYRQQLQNCRILALQFILRATLRTFQGVLCCSWGGQLRGLYPLQ